jgi:hypothetical protein
MEVWRENAAPPAARIAAEVTLIAVSPDAALVSSTRIIVVSRGSRWPTRSSIRAKVGSASPRLCPRCSNFAIFRCAVAAATVARQRPRATQAEPRLNCGGTTLSIAANRAPSSVSRCVEAIARSIIASRVAVMSISPSRSLLCNCTPSQSRPSPREDPYDLGRLLTEIARSQLK